MEWEALWRMVIDVKYLYGSLWVVGALILAGVLMVLVCGKH
jgi:hypothetical protein